MNNYDKSLQLCASNDVMRAWMTKPFIYGDYIYSTNAHLMLRVHKDLVEQEYSETEYKSVDTIPDFFPKTYSNTPLLTLTKLDLELIKNNCPKVEGENEIGQNKDCEACEGEGVVDFEFYHDGRYHYSEADCPVCNGDGLETKAVWVKNGKMEYDSRAKLKIGNSYFYMETIAVLINICENLDSEAILISQESDMKHSIFKIGDAFFLVMPIFYNDYEEQVFFTKNI